MRAGHPQPLTCCRCSWAEVLCADDRGHSVGTSTQAEDAGRGRGHHNPHPHPGLLKAEMRKRDKLLFLTSIIYGHCCLASSVHFPATI